MSRGLDAAALTAISGDPRTVYFARLDFPGGVVRVHSRYGDITLDSEVYGGLGQFGGLTDDLSFGLDLKGGEKRIGLAGVTVSQLDEVVTDNYHGRSARIYMGWLDTDGALVSSRKWVDGFMSHAQITRGESSADIVLAIYTAEDLLNRSSGRRFTDEDHQSRFSGDTFFEYLPQLQDAQIRWGGADANPTRFSGNRNLPPASDDFPFYNSPL